MNYVIKYLVRLALLVVLLLVGFTAPSIIEGEDLPFCPPNPEWPAKRAVGYVDVNKRLEEENQEFLDEGSDIGITSLLVPQNTDLLGQATFHTASKLPVQVDLGLIYAGGLIDTPPGPIQVRFYLIVNEQVVQMDEQTQVYTDIVLEHSQINVLNFTLPVLEEGIHDIVIAGIPNFDQEPAGEVGDAEGSNIRIFTHRITLIVGDLGKITVAQKNFESMSVLKEYSPEDRSQIEMMVPVTLIPTFSDEPFWWVSPNKLHPVKPSNTLNFNLLTRYQFHGVQEEAYNNGEVFTFALLAFQNYEQVSIGNDVPVLYGQFPNNAANVRIPVSFITPSTAGRHDIVFIKINYPGVPLCRLTAFGMDAFEGVRIAIDVVR